MSDVNESLTKPISAIFIYLLSSYQQMNVIGLSLDILMNNMPPKVSQVTTLVNLNQQNKFHGIVYYHDKTFIYRLNAKESPISPNIYSPQHRRKLHSFGFYDILGY